MQVGGAAGVAPHTALARISRELYRGTSLIRKIPPVGPYSGPMPRNLSLCLGTYGDPMRVGVSHERGTPVGGSSAGMFAQVRFRAKREHVQRVQGLDCPICVMFAQKRDGLC